MLSVTGTDFFVVARCKTPRGHKEKAAKYFDNNWLRPEGVSEKVPIKIGKAIIVRYAIEGRGNPDYYGRRKIAVPAKEKMPIEGLLENCETARAGTGYSITKKLLLGKRAELMIRRQRMRMRSSTWSNCWQAVSEASTWRTIPIWVKPCLTASAGILLLIRSLFIRVVLLFAKHHALNAFPSLKSPSSLKLTAVILYHLFSIFLQISSCLPASGMSPWFPLSRYPQRSR